MRASESNNPPDLAEIGAMRCSAADWVYRCAPDQQIEVGAQRSERVVAGRIEFVMHGERLRGRFALIRMKPRGKGKPQWLLMKLKDSDGDPVPEQVSSSRAIAGAPRQGWFEVSPSAARANEIAIPSNEN